MKSSQLLSSQKQNLLTVPVWLGSALLHLLVVVLVVKIGYEPTKRTEIVWISLSNTILEQKDPASAPQSTSIAPEQVLPQPTTPPSPAANVDHVNLNENPPEAELQSIAHDITIEPKPKQIIHSAPLKISTEARIKQKILRTAEPTKSIEPQARLEKVIVRNPLPAVVSDQNKPVAANITPADAETRYVQANFSGIRSKVSDSLRYPTMARRQGWQGQVQVRFNILLTGEIDNLQIFSSSGYSLLDRQALQAVKIAAPFPIPPVRANITIPVTFVLK